MILLPSDQVQRIVNGENPIRVIREHVGISLRVLALRTGIDRKLLQDIEAGKRRLSEGRAEAIAEALGVDTLALRPCNSFEECAERLRWVRED